jgi:hypothetical protein
MLNRCFLFMGLMAWAGLCGAADDPKCLAEFKAEEARIIREAERAAATNPPARGDLKAQQQIMQPVYAGLEAAARRAEECNRRSRPPLPQDATARMNECARKADQEMDVVLQKYSNIQKPTFVEQTTKRNEIQRVSDQRMACMQKAEKAP